MAFYGKYYIVLCRFNMKIQYGINKIIFKIKVASGRLVAASVAISLSASCSGGSGSAEPPMKDDPVGTYGKFLSEIRGMDTLSSESWPDMSTAGSPQGFRLFLCGAGHFRQSTFRPVRQMRRDSRFAPHGVRPSGPVRNPFLSGRVHAHGKDFSLLRRQGTDGCGRQYKTVLRFS